MPSSHSSHRSVVPSIQQVITELELIQTPEQNWQRMSNVSKQRYDNISIQICPIASASHHLSSSRHAPRRTCDFHRPRHAPCCSPPLVPKLFPGRDTDLHRPCYCPPKPMVVVDIGSLLLARRLRAGSRPFLKLRCCDDLKELFDDCKAE